MSTLEFLQNRASIPAKYLTDPAPDTEAIRKICTAGLAAPDHAAMRPWRFIVIEGDKRHRLSDVFVEVALTQDKDLPEDKLQRIREKPLRSPLIITVVIKITPDHPKTPEIEQILSAGAAAQQMQLAASALGFGSVWLTGPNAHSDIVRRALGVESPDLIAGFLYLGTSTIKAPRPKRPDVDDHLSYWEG